MCIISSSQMIRVFFRALNVERCYASFLLLLLSYTKAHDSSSSGCIPCARTTRSQHRATRLTSVTLADDRSQEVNYRMESRRSEPKSAIVKGSLQAELEHWLIERPFIAQTTTVIGYAEEENSCWGFHAGSWKEMQAKWWWAICEHSRRGGI